jgi:hypothetical protein
VPGILAYREAVNARIISLLATAPLFSLLVEYILFIYARKRHIGISIRIWVYSAFLQTDILWYEFDPGFETSV